MHKELELLESELMQTKEE